MEGTHCSEENIHKSSIAKFEEKHTEYHGLPDRKIRAAAGLETGPKAHEQDTSCDHEGVGNKLLADFSKLVLLKRKIDPPRVVCGPACRQRL